MIRIAFIACAVIAVASADEDASNFVKKLQHCNATDNECLKEAIQKATPLFVEGVPELDLEPIDPFLKERETLEYNFGPIRAKVVLKNFYTYGISKQEILAVRSIPTVGSHYLAVDVRYPTILIDGHYNLEGQVSLLKKLGGDGFFNVSMAGLTATWNIYGRVENDRWIVEQFIMYPDVEEMEVYVEDLFNGNEKFNNEANEFANKYWQLLYRILLPVAAKKWDKGLTEYLNKFFSKVSYSELFP